MPCAYANPRGSVSGHAYGPQGGRRNSSKYGVLKYQRLDWLAHHVKRYRLQRTVIDQEKLLRSGEPAVVLVF